MQMTQDAVNYKFRVNAYMHGNMVINTDLYECSVLLTPTLLVDNFLPEHYHELTAEHLHRAADILDESISSKENGILTEEVMRRAELNVLHKRESFDKTRKGMGFHPKSANEHGAVALIGTGFKRYPVAENLLDIFYKNRIGVEVMKTSSACKTFNLLASDGRRVVALLLTGN